MEHELKCEHCNADYSLEDLDNRYPIVKKMVDHHICFQCAYWLYRKELDDNYEKVIQSKIHKITSILDLAILEEGKLCIPLIIGNNHFSVDAKKSTVMAGSIGPSDSTMLSCYHRYLRFDGLLIATNNLWQQGNIPDRFKDMFPDNCVELDRAEYLEIKYILDTRHRIAIDLEEAQFFLKKFNKI